MITYALQMPHKEEKNHYLQILEQTLSEGTANGGF